MTALAGLVGRLSPFARERACRQALAAQRAYAREPAQVESLAEATFAISRFGAAQDDGPLTSSTPDLLAAADVALHNRTELIAALSPGAALPNKPTDTEIVAAAWLRWGERCFDRLAGDYAVALYEPRHQRLILARDPIGERPLFYRRDDGVISFASMPSGLFGDRKPRPDLPRLARRLAGQDDYGPATWFEDIHRVLPGELVVVTPGGFTTALHWQPAVDEPLANSRAELVESYRSLLDEAVRCRLADQSRPVATHLSAGYDSSAVTATAARLRGPGQRIIAYTSAPVAEVADLAARGRFADESQIAGRTAALLGVEHHVVRVGEPLMAPVRDFVRSHQSIATPLANVRWWSKINELAATAGARVLLTGELGNYGLSAGGLPVLGEWIRRRQWSRWLEEARAVRRRGDVRLQGLLFASFSPWLPERLADTLFKLGTQGTAASDRFLFVRREQVPDRSRSAPRPWPPIPPGDSAAARLEIIRSHDTGMMRKGSLADSGIEERAPAVDRRLIEFALRLQPEQLLEGGVYKPLARAALADRLPAELLDLQSRGLQGTDWPVRFSAADARATLEEVAASPSVGELIDVPKLRRAIDRWPRPGSLGEPALEAFGLNVSMALTTGIFLDELERNPERFGR